MSNQVQAKMSYTKPLPVFNPVMVINGFLSAINHLYTKDQEPDYNKFEPLPNLHNVSDAMNYELLKRFPFEKNQYQLAIELEELQEFLEQILKSNPVLEFIPINKNQLVTYSIKYIKVLHLSNLN